MRLYATAGAMIFVAGAGIYSVADRGMNYKPAKASVFLIDRKCEIIETSKSRRRSSTRVYTDDCNSLDEWKTVREKRTKKVEGKSVVHVTYTAPQDGASHTAELRFDGRDDEFYELNAGDEINVLVSNKDPNKIIKG